MRSTHSEIPFHTRGAISQKSLWPPAGHTTCPPSRPPALVPCWGLGAETGSLSRAAGGAVGGGGVGPPLLHSTPLTQWPQMQLVVATPQTTVCAPTGGWHCLLPPGSWVAPVGPLIQTHTWSPLRGCRCPHGGAVPSQAESRCPVNRECRDPRAAAAAPRLPRGSMHLARPAGCHCEGRSLSLQANRD